MHTRHYESRSTCFICFARRPTMKNLTNSCLTCAEIRRQIRSSLPVSRQRRRCSKRSRMWKRKCRIRRSMSGEVWYPRCFACAKSELGGSAPLCRTRRKRQAVLNAGFGGYYIAKAMQTIRFKLDRSGAELASEAKCSANRSATHFVCDRPFLIVVKKRGAERPFFVMWVDNAELLCKP